MNRQRALQLYIAGATGVGLIALVVSTLLVIRATAGENLHWLPYALSLVVLCWFCNGQHVYFSGSSVVTIGTVGQVAAVILLPLPIAVLVVASGKALNQIYLLVRKQRSWRSTLLNTTSCTLSNGAGAVAFHFLHGDTYLWSQNNFTVLLALPALASLALVYHLIDTLVVSAAVTLNSGERLDSVFGHISRDARTPELSLIAVGMIFAILFHFSPGLSLLIVFPVYLSMRSFGAVARLRQETVEAVLKMAESIDYRDTGTYEHSERLADYSGRLARTVGLTPDHVKEVVLASRVHDLGKIGISNDILLKQGPLTPGERQIMEEHPVIGATILSSYSSFKDAVDIVRYHHERWDGKGYPDGLKGEQIPIGSRIISIVDSFDAMTANRPYRDGLSVEEAVRCLKDAMGTQLDARTCAAFIQLLIDDGTYVPSDPSLKLHIVSREAG